MFCCGYKLTDFPISIRLTSLALWQSNDCPSASKATLMNMDKYFTWIHYERLHNHKKAKHNKTVCIFLGIYCKVIEWQSSTSYVFAKCTDPIKTQIWLDPRYLIIMSQRHWLLILTLIYSNIKTILVMTESSLDINKTKNKHFLCLL